MASYPNDPVQQNVEGVRQLVESPLNKTTGGNQNTEGALGDFVDVLSLDLAEPELLKMSSKWESDYAGYESKIKARQATNLKYYMGKQEEGSSDSDKVVPSNLIFEATETFIPAALAKNPEPVVYPASQGSPEATKVASDVKTMLQYHADILVLRRKLALMVRHWDTYLIGAIKHGWDKNVSDIECDLVLPNNFIFSKDASIDVYGNYTGSHLGERKKDTAQELLDKFPDISEEKKAYINATVDGKLGTEVGYTEWRTNEYCFYTYKGMVLDKHQNEYWNYEGDNHFGRPKMPYTFLSVFSMGTQPHDITSLIEQSIPNQDLVNKRIKQIDQNLDVSNNSLAVSAENFNNETAKQAADAVREGSPILVPRGKSISEAIMRLPATQFPNDAFNQLQDMTERLRSIYGTLGISASGTQDEKTVRGKIITSQQDSSRIGGGIGDALEQVADNIFNWWVQLYKVFYDEEHYAAVLGQGNALQYVTMSSSKLSVRVVVSVSPNSMKPKDEVTEMNQSLDLWNAHALDPLTLFERLNDSDPKQTAARVVMWTTNPQQYAMTYFPESPVQPQPQQPGAPVAAGDQNIPTANADLSQSAPNPSLSQVPITNAGVPNL